MTNQPVRRAPRGGRAAGVTLLGAAVASLSATTALGIGFENESGTITGSWDTTISYGLSLRMEQRDRDIIGIANGGTGFSVNGDNGNLNFSRGKPISNLLKVTSELGVDVGNFGFFARGYAFHDFEIENQSRDRTELTKEARDLIGSRAELLDAFMYARFDIAGRRAQIRVGEQIVSWGESTFIQNGINAINHIDVTRIRAPGTELREALLPQGLVWFSVDPTENATIELVYQYDWDEFEIDPEGSYFSFNDFVPVGGKEVFLGFGDIRDIDPQIPYAPCDVCSAADAAVPTDHQFQGIPRGATRRPESDDQYGGALRWYLPNFNGGTELGFYYYRYHRRLPLINGRTGTAEGFGGAAAISGDAGNIAAAAGAALAADPTDIEGAVQAGAAAAGPLIAPYAAEGIAAAAATGGDVASTARAYAIDVLGQTSRYFTIYPKDIQLFGVSFNTTVGDTALQGEYSFKKDVPLQVDDLEVLFAALSPISDDLAQGQLGSFSFNPISPQFNPNTPPETVITGFKRLDVSQFQVTATRVFPPTWGASQAVLLFEGAFTHVHDFPSKDELRLNGPGTFVSGNAALGPVSHPGKDIEEPSRFADQDSWGYRLAGRLDYLNAIGPWNVFPFFSWRHDVSGISPGPGGNFLEGQKALTVGVRTDYQSKWEASVSYALFAGASRYNLLNDRDFLSLNVRYSF